MEKMFVLTAQLNWTSLAFDLFQEVNTCISVTNTKAIRGNLKIVMSRENRKGNLEVNLFNVFTSSYLFELAYSD